MFHCSQRPPIYSQRLRVSKVGNEKVLTSLGDWKGAEEWGASQRGVWLSEAKGETDGQKRRPIGYVKVRQVTRMSRRGVTHVYPFDQPTVPPQVIPLSNLTQQYTLVTLLCL